ncbi:MAG: hypothetical protein CJBNEKGG_01817 [Prosthecobacter sp.]|nr:hypothetical protein [Prosthecobacter sp.]
MPFRPPVRPLVLILSALLGAAAEPGHAHAQAGSKTDAAARKARELEARFPAPKPPQGRDSFELGEARQQHLQKLAPALWRKLSQREPVNLLVLAGEQELRLWNDDGGADLMNGFPACFARDLANQFYYTGGVFEAGTRSPALLAPGISLRVLTGPDHALVDAPSILASTARQSPVDLVLICHGQAEAAAGMSPAEFTRQMALAVEAVRELKAEAFVAAPWPGSGPRPEAALGQVRPLADALAETAEDGGWLFADLGDLSRLIDLPPSDAANDAQRFNRLASTWKSFFHEDADGDHLPRAQFHQRLGSALFQALLDGPSSGQPVHWEDATASWQQAGLKLRCALVNDSREEQRLTVLPLIAAGWKPRDAQPEATLPPGGRTTLDITYAPSVEGASAIPDDGLLRLPLLVITNRKASILTPRAALTPFTIEWPVGALFNQDRRFIIGARLLNTSPGEQAGTWQASLVDQKLDGRFSLKPGAALPLDLAFDLPEDGAATGRFLLELKVRLDGKELRISRPLVIAANLGLGKPLPLFPVTDSSARASFEARADASRLILACDVQGVELLPSAENAPPSWQAEVSLDARSYGKRLEPGSTAPLRFSGSSASGRGRMTTPASWAFGTGYAAVFDPKEFHARLVSSGSDRHQFEFSIPRTYLYLHEWALQNGNSQLGINLRLTLNTPSGPQSWILAPTSLPANSINALSVLELSTSPTSRATVILE